MKTIIKKATVLVLGIMSFMVGTVKSVSAQTAVLGATEAVQGASTNNTLLIIVGVILAILALLGLLFVLLRRRQNQKEN